MLAFPIPVLLSLSFLLSLFSLTAAVDPVVDVTYAQYQGTPLPNGVSEWLGLRYAAPPLGNLRFQAPQDPVGNGSVIAADQVGCFV